MSDGRILEAIAWLIQYRTWGLSLDIPEKVPKTEKDLVRFWTINKVRVEQQLTAQSIRDILDKVVESLVSAHQVAAQTTVDRPSDELLRAMTADLEVVSRHVQDDQRWNAFVAATVIVVNTAFPK